MLTACEKRSEEKAAVNDTVTEERGKEGLLVATVDDLPVSRSLFAAFKEQYASRKGKQISDQKLLDKLIRIELLARQARLKEVEKTAEAQTRFELLEKKFLADLALEHLDRTKLVTVEDVKAEYNKRYVENNVEYKVWQIVSATEDHAKSVIENTMLGGNFAKLSELHENKGDSDLGWLQVHELRPEYAEVIASLEDGKVVPEPIAAEEGWIVLYREDSRKLPAPEFDDVNAELKEYIRKQHRKNHVKALRSSAEIQIYQDVSEPDAAIPGFESKDNSPGAGGNPESLVKASNLDEVDQEIKPKSGAEAMHSIEESQQ